MQVDDSQGPKAKLAEIEAQLAMSSSSASSALSASCAGNGGGSGGGGGSGNGSALALTESTPPADLLAFLEAQTESISQLVKVALKDAHDVALIARSVKP